MHKRSLRSKHAVGTVTAVFMLLIMFMAMTGLILAFTNTNLSLEKQMKMEKEQAQEQIAITQMGVDNTQKITNVTISNTGTIEVTIRALYKKENQLATFLVDPRTTIAQGTSKTIDITSLALPAQSDSVLFAATERGVKSIDVKEMDLRYGQSQNNVNSSGLTLGPLMLTFDSLNWASCNANGNNLGQWQQRWVIPTGYCSWRLNLTNIDLDQRNLTLTQYSGFTLSLVGSPQTTTWYLKDTQQTVNFNQTAYITYLWNMDRSLASNANSNQRGVNNVFLTFFGNYSDGKSFAQTIPFEAVTIT